jgi:DNA-binding IclR family transcriptional regulator
MTDQPKTFRQGSKMATIMDMLKLETGTTLEQLVAATGWQKHTVSAALSNLQKRYGIIIESRNLKPYGVRMYRLARPESD